MKPDAAPAVAPDQVEGAAHPARTPRLRGQEAAERMFTEAWETGHLHPAWLIHGPPGVGKATFAYQAARFLLAEPAARDSRPHRRRLQLADGDLLSRRIAAGAEPRLHVLRRVLNEESRSSGPRKFHASIRVDEVRAMQKFFQLTPIQDGWRIAILDSADDLNSNAANALLKLLEEPPAASLLLLVCNAPGRMLPTLRSRCRRIGLQPLRKEDCEAAVKDAAELSGEGNAGRSPAPALPLAAIRALAAESGGSPGSALRMHALGGAALRREVDDLLASLGSLNRRRLAMFSAGLKGAENEQRRGLAVRMIRGSLADLAAHAAGARRAGFDLARRLPGLADRPSQAHVWATAALAFATAMERAEQVNIDPDASLLAAFGEVEHAARQARMATGT